MAVQRLSAALASVLLGVAYCFPVQLHSSAPPQQALAAQQAPSQLAPAEKQRDHQLIQNVENAYQNGLTNYRDGHLAAAKSNFDYAVDLMLSSGIDFNNDPDLKNELDRIVDGRARFDEIERRSHSVSTIWALLAYPLARLSAAGTLKGCR